MGRSERSAGGKGARAGRSAGDGEGAGDGKGAPAGKGATRGKGVPAGRSAGGKGAGNGKRVTLKEVAKAAGVSVGMASRVLGDYGSYSEATRARVTKAAKKLAYRPNTLARSLRLGRTKAIGLVVSNIVSYHWTTFIRGIEAAASQHGYQVILGTTADDPALERAYLQTLQERNVDGIIMSPSPANEEVVAQLIASGKALVLVECASDGLKAPRINIDDLTAARGAVEHLLELGHRRIGIVAGNQALASGRSRLQGWRDALAAAGVAAPDELVRVGDYRFEPAYRGVEELMTLAAPPTALLVCNELMTGAALQCLKDRGVSVPADVSLVAFDDPAWTSFYQPGITTVRTPRAEIAQLALETLLAVLHEPGSEKAAPVERVIATELVVRESAVAVG